MNINKSINIKKPKIPNIEDTVTGVKSNVNSKLKSKLSGIKSKITVNVGDIRTPPPKELYEGIAVIFILMGTILEGLGESFKDYIKKYNGSNNDSTRRKMIGGFLREYKMRQYGGINRSGVVGPVENNDNKLSDDPASDALLDALDYTAKNIKKVTDTGAVIIAKQTLNNVSGLISDALERVFPLDLINKPYSQIDPKLTSQLNNLTDNINLFLKDPEAKAVLRNLAKVSADIGIETIEAVRPNIEKLVDKSLETASQVGTKVAKGTVRAGLGAFITAVSTVPVVGGLAIAAIQGGTIFNDVMATAMNLTRGFKDITGDTVDAAIKLKAQAQTGMNKISEASQQVSDVYDKLQQKKQMISNPTKALMTGGRRKTRARGRKIENRIRKSLKKYFRSG